MADLMFVTEDGAAHRPAYQNAMRDIDVIERVTLVDPTGATFGETEAVIGSKATIRESTIEAALAKCHPAMAIVTMKAAHAPDMIRPLLDSGIHVMAEKPACVNVSEFTDLTKLAQDRGVHLMLALANRLRPAIADARQIISEGGIGHIYAIRATQVDDQTRIQRRLNDPDWTFQKNMAGGGHLSWLGIHTIDMMRFLTGLEIEEVAAMTPVVGGAPIDVEDLATVIMRFSGGAHGMLFSGYLMPEKGHSGFVLYGSQGWIRYNESEEGKLEWRSVDEPMRVISYGNHDSGYTPWVEQTLSACVGECAPPISAADGLAALQVVHAAYNASESRSTIRLNQG